MKKNNLIKAGLLVTSLGLLVSCGPKEEALEPTFFGFSVSLKSGLKTITLGDNDQILEIYDNGINTSGRTYQFESDNEEVATIDPDTGEITPIAPGEVQFFATELNSGEIASIGAPIKVVAAPTKASGGFNYAAMEDPNPVEAEKDPDYALNEKTKVLSQLERYSMDNHLTGITLFDNGGYIKYSDRVQLKSQEYITGFGFGLLSDGAIDESKALPGLANDPYQAYYHGAISQDSLKINQYSATGSQVGDLASYITSTYWGTRRATGIDPATRTEKKGYEWYPVLAADKIYMPKRNSDGSIKPGEFEDTLTDFDQPIPLEKSNKLNMYKKWRVYVKTDGNSNPTGTINLKFKTKVSQFNNSPITIDDYIFPYQLLLTGKNNLIRGTEMANDTSHGIKGAQRYYNDTKAPELTDANIDTTWNAYFGGKLGLNKGSDVNGYYIDFELLNAIDAFTAMYTLSSSLVSPLPKGFFTGANAIGENYSNSAKIYGTFNNGENDAILDYTIACGPYMLEKWDKNSQIVFKRNDDWFEVDESHYKIKGIHNRVIDTSTDSEKVYKEFTKGKLDVAGIPTSKVASEKNNALKTIGDSTFKLNVNSCTQEQWDYLKEHNSNWSDASWQVKPWMSNSHFLDGLFFSINRSEFADKRGMTESFNYFSDSYMSNPKKGTSYNSTEEHKDAVSYYHSINSQGKDNFGYDFDRAIDNFRIAVKELSDSGQLILGTQRKPEVIKIHIRWMYQTDIKEYGEDIASYITKAFNNVAVCGGKVKLEIEQAAVMNWEEVYNSWMMKGQFDLAFGAISGNTYDPLNFLEVLKSDNSSSFTLNWGRRTDLVDELDEDNEIIPDEPLIYDGKAWSFDALWEVADHGGIVKDGKKVKPVEDCYIGKTTCADNGKVNLYKGFTLEIPLEFVEFDGGAGDVSFEFNRLDVYIYGRGNVTLTDSTAAYNPTTKKITVTVPEGAIGTDGSALDINDRIRDAQGFKKEGYVNKNSDDDTPFNSSRFGKYFDYEVYFSIKIGDSASESFVTVTASSSKN